MNRYSSCFRWDVVEYRGGAGKKKKSENVSFLQEKMVIQVGRSPSV